MIRYKVIDGERFVCVEDLDTTSQEILATLDQVAEQRFAQREPAVTEATKRLRSAAEATILVEQQIQEARFVASTARKVLGLLITKLSETAVSADVPDDITSLMED